MPVQVYICGWRETTRYGGRRFLEPELAVPGESYAVIDLRPDKTVVDGLCLFARVDDGSGNAKPTRQPGGPVPVLAGAALNGDKGDALGLVARRALGNRLGMDLSAIKDMRMLVSEIVHIGPLLGKVNGGRKIVTATRQNRLETWIGGEMVHDIPAVAGGAFTEPYTYSNSDLSTHSPWADVAGTQKVVSNHCQPNFAGSYDVARYDTALASGDHYCQASFNTLTAGGNYDFLAVRIRMPTSGDNGIQWEAGWAGSLTYSQFNLLVFTSGSASVIGSWDSTGGHSMPSRPFTSRLEGNGSSLSGYMGTDGPLTATDSTYSTNLRCGSMVYSEDYASSADPKTIMDDWEAGVLSTAYTKSVAGGATPAGALVKQTSRSLTSTTTPSGVPKKQTSRALTSSTTPSGLAVKSTARALAGSTASSGVVVKQTGKPLAGTTSSVGAIVQRALSRSLTSTTTPSGLATKVTSRALSGANTPSGSVIKTTSRSLTSDTTPSGDLSYFRLLIRSLSGTVDSTGALVKSTARALAGSTDSSGALTRLTSKTLSGSVDSSGALAAVRSFLRSLGGTVDSSGVLTKLTSRALTSSTTPSGDVTKTTSRSLTATITSSGTLAAVRSFLRSLSGSVASSGTVTKVTSRYLTADTTPSGNITKLISRALTGTATSSGAVTKTTSRGLTSTTTSSGAVTKLTSRALMSITTPSGNITKLISRVLTSDTTPSGSLLSSLNGGIFVPLAKWSRAVADVIRSKASADRIRSRARRPDGQSRSDPS